MKQDVKITMDTAVCPACAVPVPKRNNGCPHCGYTFVDGRIGSMREMLAAPSGEFNQVSSAFLRLIAQAAAA